MASISDLVSHPTGVDMDFFDAMARIWPHHSTWAGCWLPAIRVALKAVRCRMQEFGGHRQIDLGAFRMGMAEIGGQHGRQPLHIRPLTIPAGQAVNREAVPEIVQARDLSPACRAVDSGDAP